MNKRLSNSDDTARFPFIFGSQYYRPPTPEPECWETDFRMMRKLGFNAVKVFMEWRWSHRGPNRFYFEDMDRVMDMADRHELGVTINFALDTAPLWLFKVHSDARQIDCSGYVVEPCADGSRQVGGFPGPCYNHPGALADRKQFVGAVIKRFRDHPALQMWDVWNEPEQCFLQRTMNVGNMVCYCPHCMAGFWKWIQSKYGNLDRLNRVWGRCYEAWEQVEAPRHVGTVTDFIDWREFHLDTMTDEAAWRLEMVRQLDPKHGRYLHIVPNRSFSAVTCADDFAMAKNCEVFAATMQGQPEMFQHVVSAARGKVCYNVESHINAGHMNTHQRVLSMDDVLRDFLPQVGAGIKGILFWQYRPEILGLEAPAWGLVRLDGRPRPVTEAIRRFWAVIRPHAAQLRTAFPAPTEIGIWRSRRNEIFHFCMQNTVRPFNASIDAYIQFLYWESLPHRLINSEMLANGELDGLRMLIMPSCYYMTQQEANSLDRWVRSGGVLICEAHLAAYNGTIGRHSRTIPGCGLAESWGICEMETTSSIHLPLNQGQAFKSDSMSVIARKALKDPRASGGKFFPIRMSHGTLAWGAHRYAELGGEGLVSLGTFDGVVPCMASKPIGKGVIFYCGTNLGQAAEFGPTGLRTVLQMATAAAGIEPVGRLRTRLPGTVHLDFLLDRGQPRFAVLVSKANKKQVVTFQGSGRWEGLFTGVVWNTNGATRVTIPARFAEIFEIRHAAKGKARSKK